MPGPRAFGRRLGAKHDHSSAGEGGDSINPGLATITGESVSVDFGDLAVPSVPKVESTYGTLDVTEQPQVPVKVNGYLVVCRGTSPGEVSVYDVSDKKNITEVDKHTLDSGGVCVYPAYHGQVLIVSSDSTVYTLKVAQDGSITELDTASYSGTRSGATLGFTAPTEFNNVIYAVDGGNGIIELIDYTDPKDAYHLGTVSTSAAEPGYLHFDGDKLLVSEEIENETNGTAEIFDISDPTSPSSLGTYTNTALGGGTLRGNIAYFTKYSLGTRPGAGVEAVDFTDPANPSMVKQLDIPNPDTVLSHTADSSTISDISRVSYGIRARGDYLYIIDREYVDYNTGKVITDVAAIDVIDISEREPKRVYAATDTTGNLQKYQFMQFDDGYVYASPFSAVSGSTYRIKVIEAESRNFESLRAMRAKIDDLHAEYLTGLKALFTEAHASRIHAAIASFGSGRIDKQYFPIKSTVSSNTTISRSGQFVPVDSSGGAITITLDSAILEKGAWVVVNDAGGSAGTNAITIDTGGSSTIDGSTSISISTNNGQAALYANDSNWFTW